MNDTTTTTTITNIFDDEFIFPNNPYLEELDVSYNDLTALPPDFAQRYPILRDFRCNNNKLTELPEFPETLKYLFCSNNLLNSLDILPPKLNEIFCYNNNIIRLPKELPNLLYTLDCSCNLLKELPDVLPPLLSNLNCSTNQLTVITELPPNIIHLYIGNNKLTELPKLSPTILKFDCDNNPLELPETIPKNSKISLKIYKKFYLSWLNEKLRKINDDAMINYIFK